MAPPPPQPRRMLLWLYLDLTSETARRKSGQRCRIVSFSPQAQLACLCSGPIEMLAATATALSAVRPCLYPCPAKASIPSNDNATQHYGHWIEGRISTSVRISHSQIAPFARSLGFLSTLPAPRFSHCSRIRSCKQTPLSTLINSPSANSP